MLNMDNLKNCFESAIKENARFVGVLVQVKDNKSKELIINERPSFEDKVDYYQKAYDKDLNHLHADNIRIVGFTQADGLSEMEKLLLLTR